jgi:hypothetical protein
VGELPLLSTVVGAIIGGAHVYWDSLRRRKNAAAGRAHVPEVRQPHSFLLPTITNITPKDAMPVAMLGAILFPVGIFLFSWTAGDPSLHWTLPLFGAIVLSIPLFTLFVAFLSYLSESYLEYAASAQAGNQIIRCLVASTAPLWSRKLFDSLGVGGGGSVIGAVAVVLMPIPFVLWRYGGGMRAASKFAPAGRDADDRRGKSDIEKGVEASFVEGKVVNEVGKVEVEAEAKHL